MIRNKSGVLLVGAVLSLFAGTLAVGAWKHYTQHEDTLASAEQRRTFVPTVRVATVKPTSGELTVSLPATTSAFAAANIFARASGYVATRSVDIGDRVKAGQLLATIVAPELDHQIAQAEGTLAQLEAAAAIRPAPTRSSRASPGGATSRWSRKAGCPGNRARSTSRRCAPTTLR